MSLFSFMQFRLCSILEIVLTNSTTDNFPATFLKFSECGIPPTAVTSLSLVADSGDP